MTLPAFAPRDVVSAVPDRAPLHLVRDPYADLADVYYEETIGEYSHTTRTGKTPPAIPALTQKTPTDSQPQSGHFGTPVPRKG